jgi:hypothetical protein
MFRDDGDDSAPGTPQTWREYKYAEEADWVDPGGGDKARAVTLHRDTVTGADRIVVLQGMCGVVSGAYDPQLA